MTIEMTEKDIWVNICSKVENIIKKKKLKGPSIQLFELISGTWIYYIIELFFIILNGMPPLGLEPRCSSTAS